MPCVRVIDLGTCIGFEGQTVMLESLICSSSIHLDSRFIVLSFVDKQRLLSNHMLAQSTM